MALQPSTNPRRRPTRRIVVRWIKRSLLAALGIAIVAALVYAWLPKPVAVDTAVATRAPLAVEVAEEGRTRVRDLFTVAAPISGTLQRVDLRAGHDVNAGDVIARIEPPVPALLDERTRRELGARLASARAHESRAAAAIERAQVARDAAIREANRARTLFEHQAITAADRDQAVDTEQLAQRDLVAAQSERASAVAEVAAIQAQLGEAGAQKQPRVVTVTAPISGRVLRVVRDSAGPIATGAPIVDLGDTSTLEVVVDVLSSDAARIRPGMPVDIEAWGGDQTLRGDVTRVEPSAFTRISALGVEEQRVKVIVGLESPPAALGDGFRVEARIVTWQGTNVLVIPLSAVFRDHGAWAVYALDHGRARLRHVALGHRGPLDIEVVTGLAAGDVVVLHPSDQIRDGVKLVRYAHETPAR